MEAETTKNRESLQQPQELEPESFEQEEYEEENQPEL